MSSATLGLLSIAGMVVFLFLRQPVWLAMGVGGVLANWWLNGSSVAMLVSGTTFFDTASSFNLAVIPLFVLMGEVATSSRMSAELFNAARVVLSGVRGALSIASIAAAGAFGAICGSSVATAASMSRIAMPEMARAGYDEGYSAASVAAGGSLGILIPPSIILVIYGSISETSVARLFAASMLPGILMLALYMIIALVVAHRRGAAPDEASVGLAARLRALREPWQFALLFTVTIGGMYAGVFSPNEAAAIGAFGAILLGFLKRSLTFAVLVRAIEASVVVSCSLFLIVVAAGIFSNFVVQTRLPEALLGGAQSIGLPPFAVMSLIVASYIVMGCFLEGLGMVLITVPVFLPIVTGLGYDPIWFGVLVTVLVELGLITPPVGMNLFIIKAQVPGLSLSSLYRGIVPFLIAPTIVVIVLFALPQIALWLPAVLY
ncbi:MAG: TRAP transporter large permease [Mesorhizobium sp.]|nr:TRAP transporter large permease [Mesorhizobium sp.]MCO5162718.1 TRAP transporter large permease [Mesorhizobium sp.]